MLGEHEYLFYLGILIGLAIYNGVVLDVKFPLAMYKKLLNCSPSIEDLHELDPVSYFSLTCSN